MIALLEWAVTRTRCEHKATGLELVAPLVRIVCNRRGSGASHGMTIRRIPRIVTILSILCFVAGIAHADLSRVRHERSGRGHHYLSTHVAVPVGGVEVSLSLFILGDRYVALYSESKRIDASRSQVVLQSEINGSVSGLTLGGLGTARVLAETKNGKPVVELTLAQPIASSPAGLTLRLAWTYGSWAPPSVAQ